MIGDEPSPCSRLAEVFSSARGSIRGYTFEMLVTGWQVGMAEVAKLENCCTRLPKITRDSKTLLKIIKNYQRLLNITIDYQGLQMFCKTKKNLNLPPSPS